MAVEIKATLPFSFDEIYAGIEKKFKEKGYDSPYDGSNLAQLITSMAYTTSMLNANTAININETILPLAQKRPNIIQDARLLGYESTPKVSYIYELEIEFAQSQEYYIPHHTKFTANSKDYYYMGDGYTFDARIYVDGDPSSEQVFGDVDGNMITTNSTDMMIIPDGSLLDYNKCIADYDDIMEKDTDGELVNPVDYLLTLIRDEENPLPITEYIISNNDYVFKMLIAGEEIEVTIDPDGNVFDLNNVFVQTCTGTMVPGYKKLNKRTTIKVKEGTLIKHTDEPDNLSQVIGNLQYLDIPYTNIEANGIEVFITFYTSDGILATREKYFKSDTLLIDKDDDLYKKFIRLENIELKTPRIHFTISEVGTPIPSGAIIEMNVLISSGPGGEMTEIPSTDFSGIEINKFTISVKGADVESNQSIKDNAPLLHNTASRCVTANDYEVICRKHSACKEAFVFGGEDEHPIKLGNVYLSMIPEKMERKFSNDADFTEWTLDDKELNINNYVLSREIESTEVDSNGNIKDPGVLDNIKALNLPALRYNIRNPHYIFMNFEIKVVKYALASVQSEVREKIFEILNKHILSLEKYESEFFKSNTIKRIDEYLTDIAGLEMDVTFQIAMNKENITTETVQTVQKDIDGRYTGEIINSTENAMYIYLDAPYEPLYNTDGVLQLDNLPNIDTENFMDGRKLFVDTSNYDSSVNTNTKWFFDDEYLDFDTFDWDQFIIEEKENNTFKVMLGDEHIGNYTVYNERVIYIRVKIFTDTLTFEEDGVDIVRYLDLKYPSQNMSTYRTGTFKLNSVKIQ